MKSSWYEAITKHKLLTNSLQPLSMNSRISVLGVGEGTLLTAFGEFTDGVVGSESRLSTKVDGSGLISASRPWRSDSSRDRAWLRNLSHSSSAGSSSWSSSSTHSDRSLELDPPSLQDNKQNNKGRKTNTHKNHFLAFSDKKKLCFNTS